MNPTVISAVVKNNLCIGCGVCAAICPEKTLDMSFNRFGEYNPFQKHRCTHECGLCLRVCPFADGNPNEDLLGTIMYENIPGIGHSPETGYYLDSYVGFAKETREHGSSGGMTSWLLSTLIKKGVVDYVIAVVPNHEADHLFRYSILSTPESVLDSAGSAYYPVEFSGVLKEIQNMPGRCVVIGLPCFIKAIRLATIRNKKLKEKIGITAGLVCGQLKSKNFTEYISVLSGVHWPLKKVQYRGKSPLFPSTNYYYSFSGDSSPEKRIFWNDGISEAWTNRWFTPNACNFCDDVFAECADVTFMDAWLPEYSSDYRGTNLVLVRSQLLNEIIQDGMDSSLLSLNHIPVQEIIRSQKGVINVKKRDIAYRLYLARSRNLRVPAKREHPGSLAFHPLHRKEIELKEQMRVISRTAWIDQESREHGGLETFRRTLDPYISCLNTYVRIRILLSFPLNVLRSFRKKSGVIWMGEERPLIILAGNGPYENRGCEAIVRGTVEIFRQYIDEPEFVSASFFNTREQFELQKAREPDPHIRHIPINVFENTYSRYNPVCYFRYGICNISDWANGKILFKNMDTSISKARCVLSVGGDNYQQKGTKLPRNYISLDNYVLRHHIPFYLWGASVGPFSREHDHEKYMAEHLDRVTMIFARETATIEYLTRIGMKKKITRVADPAFMMKPRKPAAGNPEHIPHGSIGLNFSPLMALFTTNGNLDRWSDIVRKIITDVYDELGCRIFLVPHVIIPGRFNNDYLFLKSVMADLPRECDVVLVPDSFSAEELKWIISSMKIFIGARTHSTIAALSTCVPTISLSYSIKSIGINQDIFGSQEYCIPPSDDYAKITTKKIVELYHNSVPIKKYLTDTIPHFKKLSCLAGEIVSQEILSGSR